MLTKALNEIQTEWGQDLWTIRGHSKKISEGCIFLVLSIFWTHLGKKSSHRIALKAQ